MFTIPGTYVCDVCMSVPFNFQLFTPFAMSVCRYVLVCFTVCFSKFPLRPRVLEVKHKCHVFVNVCAAKRYTYIHTQSVVLLYLSEFLCINVGIGFLFQNVLIETNALVCVFSFVFIIYMFLWFVFSLQPLKPHKKCFNTSW